MPEYNRRPENQKDVLIENGRFSQNQEENGVVLPENKRYSNKVRLFENAPVLPEHDRRHENGRFFEHQPQNGIVLTENGGFSENKTLFKDRLTRFERPLPKIESPINNCKIFYA